VFVALFVNRKQRQEIDVKIVGLFWAKWLRKTMGLPILLII